MLHLASLFVEDVPLPPVVSFAMGTLGFLTPFDVTDFAGILDQVLDANSQRVYCTLRTRKRCEVHTYVLGPPLLMDPVKYLAVSMVTLLSGIWGSFKNQD